MKLLPIVILSYFCIPSYEAAKSCQTPNGFFGNPKDSTCNTFIQCSFGVPYLLTCPSQLVFDPNRKVCVWPYEYVCPFGRRAPTITPTPTTTSTTLPSKLESFSIKALESWFYLVNKKVLNDDSKGLQKVFR